MIDGSSTPEDAIPAGTEKSKSKSFYEHLVEDGHVTEPGNVQNKGDVASYENSQPSDLFNPAKIVERWQGESKGVPAPEGFDAAKFDPQEIKKRWEGKIPPTKGDTFYQGLVEGGHVADPGAISLNEAQRREYFDNAKIVYEEDQKKKAGGGKPGEIEKVDTEDVGGKLSRKGWRENDPGAKYDEWIKGAGRHSKLGKTYVDLQAKVREASVTKLVPRAVKDINSTPIAKK